MDGSLALLFFLVEKRLKPAEYKSWTVSFLPQFHLGAQTATSNFWLIRGWLNISCASVIPDINIGSQGIYE